MLQVLPGNLKLTCPSVAEVPAVSPGTLRVSLLLFPSALPGVAEVLRSRVSKALGCPLAVTTGSYRVELQSSVPMSPKGSLTSGSRRRISCKDLGHGDCEGWLWKKKDAKGYFTQKWKKYWFILKDSSLYWYTNQNDEKAEGFISLPEFRIDRAIECRRKLWMNRLGLAAIGYTPDDKVTRPDEDYWSESDQDEIDGSLTLKQEGPSSMCDTYHRTPSVNSSSPFPETKHGRHFSSESTYSHSSAEDSRQDATGSTHSSGCRPAYRERRSWQDLIETPLTSSGLHFLQTVPSDPEYAGGRLGMSPERRRQATLPVQRRHHTDRDGPFPLVECERGLNPHRRAHKQRSQSLPRNRDVRGKGNLHPGGLSEEKSEDDEVHFRKHNGSCQEGFREEEKGRESCDGLQELYKTLEQASLSAFGEQRPSTKQEFRRSFIKRCNDPVINEKLHLIRALRSTLKAKEGDLCIINQVLDDPNLNSKKFREWKQRHHELFMDICSRFKKIMFSLGLAAAGTAVCYPAQAVTAVKVTGKSAYSAGIWASGALSSLWKPKVSARPENKESTSDPANAAKSDVYQMTETTEVPSSKLGSLFPEDGSSLSQDAASPSLVPLPNSPPQTECFPAQKSFQEIVPSTNVPCNETENRFHNLQRHQSNWVQPHNPPLSKETPYSRQVSQNDYSYIAQNYAHFPHVTPFNEPLEGFDKENMQSQPVGPRRQMVFDIICKPNMLVINFLIKGIYEYQKEAMTPALISEGSPVNITSSSPPSPLPV
ncbi:CNKR2 kinase, partial [Polypterus senegalus]